MSLRDVSISPPPKRRRTGNQDPHSIDLAKKSTTIDLTGSDSEHETRQDSSDQRKTSEKFIASPIQLNFIPELPSSSNADTISLSSILGDPLIKECWLFNYLFDIDYLLCV